MPLHRRRVNPIPARNLVLRLSVGTLILSLMPVFTDTPATAEIRTTPDRIDVVFRGAWRITAAQPDWTKLVKNTPPARVDFDLENLDYWDTSLVLFIAAASNWSKVQGVFCNVKALPESLREMVAHFEDKTSVPIPAGRPVDFFAIVGRASIDIFGRSMQYARFVGECVLSFAFLARLLSAAIVESAAVIADSIPAAE
ncbi:MAG: hypothetical protein QNK90_10680 [Opitutaceae bacterium]